jgi:hypothetical protein
MEAGPPTTQRVSEREAASTPEGPPVEVPEEPVNGMSEPVAKVPATGQPS